MPKRIKVRIDTGELCEQYVFRVPDTERKKPGPRFKTEAEREAHREAIRRRDAMRLAAKKAAEGREKPFKIRIAANAVAGKRPRLRTGAEQKAINERKAALREARKRGRGRWN